MDGLYRLAHISAVIRNKMAKRRCTILAIVKDLENENFNRRESAIDFSAVALADTECSKSLSFGFADNGKILLNAIIQNALQDPSLDLRRKAIDILGKTIKSTRSISCQSIIDTLRLLIYEEDNRAVVQQAAIVFCNSIQASDHMPSEMETLVDLMNFEDALVRSEALKHIALLDLGSSKVALFLLEKTDFLTSSSILLDDNDFVKTRDCTTLLDVCRKLARYPTYHRAIGAATDFLGAIVRMIVDEEIKNRNAHYHAVELVIDLLSRKENIPLFLSYKELLPWLISFVNVTTADDHFKKEVVRSIIRLSVTLLK
jgi:hypothetical protein